MNRKLCILAAANVGAGLLVWLANRQRIADRLRSHKLPSPYAAAPKQESLADTGRLAADLKPLLEVLTEFSELMRAAGVQACQTDKDGDPPLVVRISSN